MFGNPASIETMGVESRGGPGVDISQKVHFPFTSKKFPNDLILKNVDSSSKFPDGLFGH